MMLFLKALVRSRGILNNHTRTYNVFSKKLFTVSHSELFQHPYSKSNQSSQPQMRNRNIPVETLRGEVRRNRYIPVESKRASSSKVASACENRIAADEKKYEVKDCGFKKHTKNKSDTKLSEVGDNKQLKKELLAKEDNMAKELANICHNYSKAHGSYVAWETEVNLSPPKSWDKPDPEGDVYIQDYYRSLQYTLYETDHPETLDRSAQPRTRDNKEGVNVAYLASPVECIGILLEGGKHLPDGFHLVLSPSWLTKVPLEKDPSLSSLLLHKSISFHAGGMTFIDEYNPPRKVSYFVNFFTENVTSGQRNDGVEIEKDIDCPMSSSMMLCALVDDKVWTRDIMAEVGMEIPETLAIIRAPARKLPYKENKIMTQEFESYSSINMSKISQEIEAFSKSLQNSGIQKIIVKPSGPKYLGSVGISIHQSADVSSILASVDELLMELDEGCAVLVEEFIEHILPQGTDDDDTIQWTADPTLGIRVRVTVIRDHDDTPVTTLINCNIGDKSVPINGDVSICQSLDSTLIGYNIADKMARKQLEETIRVQSADIMKAIIEKEKLLSLEERGTLRGQTDVIGIDMIVTMKGERLLPVGIEVNSHDCTINAQLYDFMARLGERMLVTSSQDPDVDSVTETLDNKERPEDLKTGMNALYIETTEDLSTDSLCRLQQKKFTDKLNIQKSRYRLDGSAPQSVRPLIRTMIARSQMYMMMGKQVLVIGGGGFSKRHLWPDAAAYGVKIVLVDADPNHFARDHVHQFIHFDFEDHGKDFAHACDIVNILQVQGIHVDGCLTFWEDCGPLAALVHELLGTRGSSYKAALTAKKKSKTRNVLVTKSADIPHWPRTHLYSSKAVHITEENDLHLVAKQLQFPVILKLEHGSSAVGVTVVKTEDELRAKYHEITDTLKTKSDYPGIGLGYDNTMVANSYHEGSEHDVDVIMYDRKMVGAFLSDNGQTRDQNFIETAASMPSCLPVDKQAQILTAAYQCCTEIGLSDGVFNVELLMTKTGPKLIEINARMGGFYLREWIKNIYCVDIMLYSLMIACSVKPYVPKQLPDSHLIGVMLIPSLHAHLLKENNVVNRLKELEDTGDILFVQLGDPEEEHACHLEEPVANVAVYAKTTQAGKQKLIKICKDLGIDQDTYQVEHFLKYL